MKVKTVKYYCDYCGKEAEQKTGNYNRYNIHFCSLSCSSSYKWEKFRKEKGIDVNEKVLCACGCGTELLRWKKNGNSWADYKDLRRDINNGITLCVGCHYYVHSKAYQNELEVK